MTTATSGTRRTKPAPPLMRERACFGWLAFSDDSAGLFGLLGLLRSDRGVGLGDLVLGGERADGIEIATISVSGSTISDEPWGSFRSAAVMCVPSSRPSTSTSMRSGMWVASTSSSDGVGVLRGDRAGSGLADERDRDVDLDLLALLHDEEVDVLDDLVHRVLLHVLDQRELRLPATSSSSTALARRISSDDLVAGQRDVHGVGAVTVDDGGDLAGGAEAAGEALAEVLANLGLDLVVGLRTWGSPCGRAAR